jgi:hypothetical protein
MAQDVKGSPFSVTSGLPLALYNQVQEMPVVTLQGDRPEDPEPVEAIPKTSTN